MIDAILSAEDKSERLRQIDALIKLEMDELDNDPSEGMRLACRNALKDLSVRRELLLARPVG